MKKLALALAFLLSLSSTVSAQLPLTGVGPGTLTTGGGGSYTGPGDLNTYIHWYGLRAYNGTQATALAAAINLCDPTGVTCNDIHVTSTGVLNNTELTTLGCTVVNTCLTAKIYDRIGTCDLTATGSGRPFFYPTAMSGAKPALNTNGGIRGFTSSCASFSNAWTWTFVVNYSTGTSNGRAFNGNDPIGVLQGSGGDFAFFGSGVYASGITATIGTWFASVYSVDGSGNATIYANASNASGSAGSGSTGGSLNMGVSQFGGNGMDGYFAEGGIIGSNLNSTAANAWISNARTYGGY